MLNCLGGGERKEKEKKGDAKLFGLWKLKETKFHQVLKNKAFLEKDLPHFETDLFLRQFFPSFEQLEIILKRVTN